MAYRFEVHLRTTNQTGTLTTNVNGDTVKYTRRGVRLGRNDKSKGGAFIPWGNVAFIDDLGVKGKL